jgi:hypothetical protein
MGKVGERHRVICVDDRVRGVQRLVMKREREREREREENFRGGSSTWVDSVELCSYFPSTHPMTFAAM